MSNLDVIIELAEILGIMLILSLHLSLSFSLDFHRTHVVLMLSIPTFKALSAVSYISCG